MPAGMSALYADLQTTKYRRTFVSSDEFDTEYIAATLKDGLLTVGIPKCVKFRTRKIKAEVPQRRLRSSLFCGAQFTI